MTQSLGENNFIDFKIKLGQSYTKQEQISIWFEKKTLWVKKECK